LRIVPAIGIPLAFALSLLTYAIELHIRPNVHIEQPLIQQ
jgi:hypothetical protein